jgi:hypothetical protein
MVGESNAPRFEQDGTIKFEINEHTLFTSILSRFHFIGICFLLLHVPYLEQKRIRSMSRKNIKSQIPTKLRSTYTYQERGEKRLKMNGNEALSLNLLSSQIIKGKYTMCEFYEEIK